MTLDYGGILGISETESTDYGQAASGIAFIFVPVLTLARLVRRRSLSLIEAALCVCTLAMLAFTMSLLGCLQAAILRTLPILHPG